MTLAILSIEVLVIWGDRTAQPWLAGRRVSALGDRVSRLRVRAGCRRAPDNRAALVRRLSGRARLLFQSGGL